MIELTVLAGQTAGIDFAPASEYAEILQNVRTILATPVYSVPLDRNNVGSRPGRHFKTESAGENK